MNLRESGAGDDVRGWRKEREGGKLCNCNFENKNKYFKKLSLQKVWKTMKLEGKNRNHSW